MDGHESELAKLSLLALLQEVSEGVTAPEEALKKLKSLPFQSLGDIKFDHHRAVRRGVPEIVFGQGKSLDHLKTIIDAHIEEGRPLFITRVDRDTALSVKQSYPEIDHCSTASTLRIGTFKPDWEPAGKVAVVGAGMSDLPIVQEVMETLTYLSCPYNVIHDAGVAGMHRFMEHWNELSEAPVIVAVAGMEGALPSVLGGLFPGPIIGVPTSVGYGTNLGGFTPLLSMLNSCTAGVAVVNVDNGVAAGYIATLINRTK